MKNYKLLKSEDKLGYTKQEILSICKDLKIHHKSFWKAFGVNTVAVGADGTSRYYTCDIERALYQLGKPAGVNHIWD